MNIQYECLPCLVNQALRIADITGCTDKETLLRKVFLHFSQADYNVTSPEIAGDIFKIITETVGNPDPYGTLKDDYDRLMLAKYPALKKEIHAFTDAVRYAIAGNIIDFSPSHGDVPENLEAVFSEIKTKAFGIDHTEKMKDDLSKARRVLYMTDNCGEIVADRLLVEKILEDYPEISVTVAVHGAPIMNDATRKDAEIAGFSDICEVVDNGDYIQGTVVARSSEAFKKAYREADLVIAKGQSNFECLGDEEKRIYFLLMVKCPVISRAVGAPLYSLICKQSERS